MVGTGDDVLRRFSLEDPGRIGASGETSGLPLLTTSYANLPLFLLSSVSEHHLPSVLNAIYMT